MRFLVRVVRTTTHRVEVEAPSWLSARDAAKDTFVPDDAKVTVTADVVRQIGEPWTLGLAGTDRPDGYMERTDLLVFERAFGYVFAKSEVELLRRRVEAAVGPVAEHWNGENSDMLSIQTQKPFGKLTDEQVASIMAPVEAT
jgi:hypothetical protein